MRIFDPFCKPSSSTVALSLVISLPVPNAANLECAPQRLTTKLTSVDEPLIGWSHTANGCNLLFDIVESVRLLRLDSGGK
jgi:hypothetical protein